MFWLKLLVVIGAGLTANLSLASDLQRVDRQVQSFNCTPAWHFKFTDFTSPELRAIHDGTKLKFCYRDPVRQGTSSYYYSCIDTQDYFTFENYSPLQYAKEQHLDWLLYDDNKVGKPTNLSVRDVYPAIIAVGGKDGYSSTDDNVSWLKKCEDCVQATIAVANTEIFKSNDGLFWASFNDNNTVITSRDMRTWMLHKNLNFNVSIHNSFPIKMQGQDKWVLIQIINKVYNYYVYYYGTMSYDNGYQNESPAANFTFGGDDPELFFANRGDIVDDYQIALVVLVNDYFGTPLFGFLPPIITTRAPIILGTPRKVMFRDIGDGKQRLIQEPATNFYQIPLRGRYTFSNVDLNTGEKPLSNIFATRFTITDLKFDLKNAKEVGIHIRKSPDATDYVQIGFLKQDAYYVDRGKSALPSGFIIQRAKKYNRRFDARINNPFNIAEINFLIHADGCLLEVFAEYFTINFNLIILSPASYNRMEIISSRDGAILTSLQLLTYD